MIELVSGELTPKERDEGQLLYLNTKSATEDHFLGCNMMKQPSCKDPVLYLI